MFENITDIAKYEDTEIKLVAKIQKPENIVIEVNVMIGEKVIATFQNDDTSPFKTTFDFNGNEKSIEISESPNSNSKKSIKIDGEELEVQQVNQTEEETIKPKKQMKLILLFLFLLAACGLVFKFIL